MQNTLTHYGIKGMKWGVRRYQNKDGTLTPAGKKRISKQYAREVNEVNAEFAKKYSQLYMESYNKAADRMNNGMIARYNSQQRKKYGENYMDREGYMDDYEQLFDKVFAKEYSLALNDFYKNSASYKKAKKLVDKYGMTSWDDLAKQNEAQVQEIREYAEKTLKR